MLWLLCVATNVPSWHVKLEFESQIGGYRIRCYCKMISFFIFGLSTNMLFCALFCHLGLSPHINSVMQTFQKVSSVFIFWLSKGIQKFHKTNLSGKAATALPQCKGDWTSPPTHAAWCQHSHTTHTSNTCFHMNIRLRAEQPFTSSGIWICSFCVNIVIEDLRWIMPGFNLLTEALFSFQLGGLEGLKLLNLWPDKNQLQSTMICLEATAGFGQLCCAGISQPAGERRSLVCVCARICVLCSNCVGFALPTEHSAMWVMHCFSIGSDVQPPTWHQCLQPSCSSLIPHYPEPAESGPHSPAALYHLSYPIHLHPSIYWIPNIYTGYHDLQKKKKHLSEVLIVVTFKRDNYTDIKPPARWCHLPWLHTCIL